jgi:hypothetical protein
MRNGKCYHHGGASLSGIASGTFKDGRYSKVLPIGLLEHYRQSQNDPELLAIVGEINLVDARLRELLGKIDSGESGAAWKLLKQSASEYRKSLRDRDTEAMGLAIANMLRLIDKGAGEYRVWQEIGTQIDRRAELVVREHRRMVDNDELVDRDRILVLLSALAGVVREHVQDKATRAAISDGLTRILATSNLSDASRNREPIDVG